MFRNSGHAGSSKIRNPACTQALAEAD